MKKSLIATAFAATLPLAAAAQTTDYGPATTDPTPAPSQPAEFCQPISATAQFCAAIGTNAVQIPTPNGQIFLGVPGRVEDGETTYDQCMYIVDPGQGPVGVQCAPE